MEACNHGLEPEADVRALFLGVRRNTSFLRPVKASMGQNGRPWRLLAGSGLSPGLETTRGRALGTWSPISEKPESDGLLESATLTFPFIAFFPAAHCIS